MPYKNPRTPEARRKSREAHKRWRKKHKEHYAQLSHEQYLRRKARGFTEEQRERRRVTHHLWHEKNKEKHSAQNKANYWKNRKRRILLCSRNKQAKKEAAAGRPKPTCCDICGIDTVRIVFDHCHQRGIFRGWLCDNCNTILGRVQDNPDALRKLIAYLERTRILIPPQLTLPGI
jgi:hypothetical protein